MSSYSLTRPDQEKDRKKKSGYSLEPKTGGYSLTLEEDIEQLTPPAADDNEVSQIHGAMAGIASGIVKVPEGIFSLGAELLDFTGMTVDAAAKVEQAFDTINIFEETAEKTAAGKITQALVQIGVPATAAATTARKLALKGLRARKAGLYLNSKAKNLQKGLKKAKQLKLTTGQNIGVIALGGAAGETLVGDVEDIGTIGDVFEAGPTELDRDVQADPQKDAGRKLLNRLKFSAESIPLTGLVFGAGVGLRELGKRGKQAIYSNDKLIRFFDKVGSAFRPRGPAPQEVFLAKRTEKGRQMADTNFAMEQVKRIDKEVNQMFPTLKNFLNKTNDENRGKFFKEINDLMFEGDMKKGIPAEAANAFAKSAKKQGAKPQNVNNILTAATKVRERFSTLLDITAQGTVGMKGAAGKKLQANLRELMGDRVKQFIGTTYRIFQNQDFGFYQRYKPAEEAIEKTKELFKRYAAKNKNPITDETAEQMVNSVLSQARQYNPKTKLPSFEFDNLTQGADTPTNIKTFAQTLTKELPDGSKELKVIGKGSKVFRELFGEIEDARYSIFEGVGRLSMIARKNQLFDEILDTDQRLKDAATVTTPVGSRGFFFSTPLDARKALPNTEIVKMDDYVKEYFQDGVLINRLQGQYTSKEIAEAFSNASKVSEWMRGEKGNFAARSAAGLYRNMFLVPKAVSQYAKTVLSIPTHFRNFLSSSAFAIANGALSNPVYMVRGFNQARKSLNLGLRDPKAMEYYRELLELGVTNSNVRMGDLKNLMRDAKMFESGNVATDSILKPMARALGRVGEGALRKARAVGQGFQDLYVAEDDFWKITMYETEKLRRADAYKKAGIKVTPQQLKEEAADIVRNTIPNYAYVGDFVRTMRVTPFGNFMSWPSEVFRTSGGIFEQILKDIRDPVTGSLNYFKSTNPMKNIGLSRAAGAATAFSAIPYGIVEGAKAIFGVSDKEATAARDLGVAPWSKNSQLIFVKDPDTGELFYSDWSHNNVYDTVQRPFRTVLLNIQQGIEDEEILAKGFYEGLANAMAETANPFIGESIFTEAIGDIVARGGVTKDGVTLYTDDTPRNERYDRMLKHVVESQLPQYKQFVRVYDSATGKPDRQGDVIEIDKSLAGVFGFRLIPIKPENALEFAINDFNSSVRNSRKEFTGGKEGVIRPNKSPEEVIERFFVANRALYNANVVMKNKINSAKTLGMSEDEIGKTFIDRGRKKNLQFIEANTFKPFFPSKDIRKALIEVEQKTGQDFYTTAEPTILRMLEDFKTQNLNEPWNFKLEDYLPQPGPQSRVPLPEQPQPNPALVQQTPPVTQTGLTPTEQALLSEEERMIALRNRGMV
jgi:hypothetical protein